MTPRGAFLCSFLAFVSIVAVASSPTVLAQRTSQGVVTPDDPIWARAGAAGAAESRNGDEAPAGGRGRGAGAGQPPQPRPYDQVITSEARTDDGIFKVHRVREQLFYEIPKAELGKDFLWVSQIKRTTAGAGLGGQAAGNRVVRWELLGNRVLLRLVDYSIVADPSTPIARAVADANNPAIVRAFNVAAFSAAGDPVIEVTPLFLTEVRGALGPRAHRRAWIRSEPHASSRRSCRFPENINVEVMQTYTAPVDAGRASGPGTGAARVMRGNSATVVTSYSMVKLPEQPMMPRLFDERVGYFTRSMYDYGRQEHKATERTYITRYRLEKKDPNAAISEPVKPIVYYVDPATPAMWVPYVKKGIEDWQPAFEAAGSATRSSRRDAPADDPDWSPEDARYSVIRWLPSTDRERVGPAHPRPAHRRDSRSRHPVLSQRAEPVEELVLRAGGPARSARAALPLPDDLMGELIRYVVAHEVGHTLGFQHNMKASAMYSLEQVRDKQWVKAERPHADADGLLALQLRRAARGRHRSGRPDSEDWSVRQVGDDVGLQADSRGAHARRRAADARRVGARSRTRRRGTGSRPHRPAAAIRSTRPRPSATPTPYRRRRSA